MTDPRKLTANQIKGLHPAVRAEFRKERLTDAQARKANRLIRQPYGFKSRIALKVVHDKVSHSQVENLRGILKAMPAEAPAALLEDASFAVLLNNRPLDEAVKEVEEAALKFKEHRKSRKYASRPRLTPKQPR